MQLIPQMPGQARPISRGRKKREPIRVEYLHGEDVIGLPFFPSRLSFWSTDMRRGRVSRIYVCVYSHRVYLVGNARWQGFASDYPYLRYLTFPIWCLLLCNRCYGSEEVTLPRNTS